MIRLAAMSQRERRVVLAGSIVLVAATLTLRVVPAWRAWLADTRAASEVSIAELSRARTGIAGLEMLRDSLVARNERYLALAPSILTGTSSGAVGATLASLVSGIAAASGLELGSLTIRADTTTTGVFTRPSVRGNARGDVTGLTRFLETLERGPTILVVRMLLVTQPEPSAPNDRAETLRIEFIVEGVALERPVTELHVTETSVAPPSAGGNPRSAGKAP